MRRGYFPRGKTSKRMVTIIQMTMRKKMILRMRRKSVRRGIFPVG